jgi:hypothetical protein
MCLINPMDRTKYGESLEECFIYYMNMFPTCHWAFPKDVISVVGAKGFEEWWEGDNGWWYTIPNKHSMTATTVCIDYWGA